MWEFNYGEWTEAYVFLRLLGNGRIYAADGNFERDENVYIDILNIIRHEKDHILDFKRELEMEVVHAHDNGVMFRVLAYSELIEKANFLYGAIKNVTSKDRKFSVPEIEEYLTELKFSQPKVPKLPKNVEETYGTKTDIIVTLQDSVDHAVSTTGFSIKSHLGSASSLFNSSMASKFFYEIVGCDDEMMYEINGNHISSEIGMLAFIKNNPDLTLQFKGTSEEFNDNLDFVELKMPEILSCAILTQIGYYDRAASSKTKDIVAKIVEANPVGVRKPETWYEAKMKDFLYASFSGLTASEPWDGRKKLSGGYIDVNTSGDMLYYRAVSDDVFNTFLYEHTFFDRPSRGVNKDKAKVIAQAYLEGREASEKELLEATYKNGKPKPKKGDWGYVYKGEDGKYYISINFQIRFI